MSSADKDDNGCVIVCIFWTYNIIWIGHIILYKGRYYIRGGFIRLKCVVIVLMSYIYDLSYNNYVYK